MAETTAQSDHFARPAAAPVGTPSRLASLWRSWLTELAGITIARRSTASRRHIRLDLSNGKIAAFIAKGTNSRPLDVQVPLDREPEALASLCQDLRKLRLPTQRIIIRLAWK